MKRDTDGITSWKAHGYLYIHFPAFNILAKHPHLPHLIKCISNRTLNIVTILQSHNHCFTIFANNFQICQCLQIFHTIISKIDAEHLHFGVEVGQKPLNVLLRNLHLVYLFAKIQHFFNFPTNSLDFCGKQYVKERSSLAMVAVLAVKSALYAFYV